MKFIFFMIIMGVIMSFFLEFEKKINTLKKYQVLEPFVPLISLSLSIGLVLAMIYGFFRILVLLQ